MANVSATTSVDNFTGTGGGNNTTSTADEILFDNQNQLQAGDTLNGGAGTDTLRLDASIDFTLAGTTGVNTGLRNLEVIWINGAYTATFRSDQFGAGLLADNLTLRGNNRTQTIVINMVASAPVLNMFSWQFNNWSGGTDIIRVNGTSADERIVVSSQHTQFDGAGGSDTIDYSGWGGGFTLTLNGATWVDATWTSGLTDRLRNVENVLGSTDADTIIGDSQDNFLAGNGGNDTLSGGAGNDTLDGGTGADTMTGGVGDDTFVVDNAGDVVIERATDAGVDLVLSSVTFDASGTQRDGIENIILTGTAAINATGNALNNVLVGNSANNVLNGNAGDDTLDGGAGADTMNGGTGSDTYYVDNVSDVVVDRATDPGTDLVFSSVSFDASGTQQDGIENITLTGTANINATGNALNNTLIGTSGNNVLDGRAGADTMEGGAGNDTYYVDNVSDVVVDRATDPGTDQVFSSVNFDSSGTQQDGIENITLTGTDAINATGNTLDNVLTGNSGNNVLDGGLGADTMIGGAGNDTYFVDNIGDVVVDRASDAGTDLVYSTITFSAVGANQDGIENITLTGTAAIDATGNARSNILTGNGAANVLTGGDGDDTLIGGLGNDSLTGGSGADIFVYDGYDTAAAQADVITDFSIAAGDKISFGPSGPASFEALARYLLRSNGADTVLSGFWNGTGQSVTLIGVSMSSLTASQFIFDTSTMPRVVYGTANADMIFGGLGGDTLSGGDGVDYMFGDAGNDLLDGGAGNDVLFGDSGNDSLFGGAGRDNLNGGSGADEMTGGTDGDNYWVDDALDKVVEYASDSGIDHVYATVSYSLTGDAAGVEYLTLVGTADIDATGNALDNSLAGNSGNNTLIGGDGNDALHGNAGDDKLFGGNGRDHLNGGTGADEMTGGADGDIYWVDNVLDRVIELTSDAGIDLVYATVSYALTGDAAGVEQLTQQGTDNINATGNALANTLSGNSGNNILIGLEGNDVLRGNAGNDTLIGGEGNDALYGGTGSDVFVFAPGSGRDVIHDFSVAEDRLDLGDYGIDAFAQFALVASNVGANVVVNFGAGNTVTILNTQVHQFNDGMFV
jgi:Ca2+-binding RTX toxin-like protein